MTNLGGYAEAQEIDDHISKLLGKHEITKENLRDWRILCRTVRTSLDLIDTRVEQVEQQKMDKETERKALGIIWETYCHIKNLGNKATPAEVAFAFLMALQEGGFDITPVEK